MIRALACAGLLLAGGAWTVHAMSAPAPAPAPLQYQAMGGDGCELTPATPTCSVVCSYLDRLAVQSTAGSGVRIRCGGDDLDCEDVCEREDTLPVLGEGVGWCDLTRGTRAWCAVK